MCGIAGVFDPRRSLHEGAEAIARRMQAALSHRGPDSQGCWANEAQTVALTHTRLAIVDLSPAGHQPFVTNDGSLALTFNGEIYNHLRLRAGLERGRNVSWRGHSDTETLAESLAERGIDWTLQNISGMFAFGAFSQEDQVLSLVRDRFGQKPLFYWSNGSCLLFASELRALLASQIIPRKPSPVAVELFKAWNYVPAPWSIVDGVFKLDPGSVLEVKVDDGEGRIRVAKRRYFSARQLLERNGRQNEREISALHLVDEAMRGAIESQLLGDVPFGCFLSGGVDSALVSAITQRVSGSPLELFTIGFEDPRLDEVPRAKAIAKQLRGRHHVVYLNGADIEKTQELLLKDMDEPHGDPSFAPTWFVSKLARQQVKYVLSGDAGDEVFLGYNRHRLASLADRLDGSSWMGLRSRQALQSVARGCTRLPGVGRLLGDRLGKLSEMLSDSGPELYWKVAALDNPRQLHDRLFWEEAFEEKNDSSALLAVVLGDLTCYLPDNGLHKVDMASMAQSLEVRIPFLDDSVVGVALGGSLRSQIGLLDNKILLRRLLPKYYNDLRPFAGKRGFSPPAASWLSGPLAKWYAACRESRRSFSPMMQRATEGILAAEGERRSRWSERLWGACILSDWCERNDVRE